MTSPKEHASSGQGSECPPPQEPPPGTAPERLVEVCVHDRDGDKLPIADAPVTLKRGEPLRVYRTDRQGRARVLALPGDSVVAQAFGCSSDEKVIGQTPEPVRLEIAVGFSIEIVGEGSEGSCPTGYVTQGRPLWIRLGSNRSNRQGRRPRFAITQASQGQVLSSPLDCDSETRFVSEFAYDSRRASGRVDFTVSLSDEDESSQASIHHTAHRGN